MDALIRESMWSQFGAAIDMLENAIQVCPDDLWFDRSSQPQYWYVAYHTLFWLDLYLFGSIEGFTPPPPFTRDELDPDGPIPQEPYARDLLHDYLLRSRERCRTKIDSFTEENAAARHHFGWGQSSGIELIMYNMRHVQHHTAQLNLMLRQSVDDAPVWVTQAELT